ncbi:MAG: TIGR00730 family Rossman fold protein [Bacteroidota bacterium]
MKKYLTVYCGSSTGSNSIYKEQAKELGRIMVENDYYLIYGAGNVGLMGIIADEVLRLGGEVIGVIPQHLVDKEVAHHELTELIITDTMHERKAIMAERTNGFIAMPGGFGTLEEVVEVMTWTQLGLHQKPIAFFNVDGYYSKLFEFFKHMIEERFLKSKHIDQLILDSDAQSLMHQIATYSNTYTPKWLQQKNKS